MTGRFRSRSFISPNHGTFWLVCLLKNKNREHSTVKIRDIPLDAQPTYRSEIANEPAEKGNIQELLTELEKLEVY